MISCWLSPFSKSKCKPEEVHRHQPPETEHRGGRASLGANGTYPKQLGLCIFFGFDNMELNSATPKVCDLEQVT